MPEFRTVLEQKIRERRQTLEEFVEYAETFAREHEEPGTLGVRHLQRLVAGRRPDGRPLGPVRPATGRLLERIFGISADALLAPPERVANNDSADKFRQMLMTSGQLDDGVVTLLRDQLTKIRELDRQLGAAIGLEEVESKVHQVSRLLAYSLSPKMREQLSGILSDLHTLAGWQKLDLGKVTESWMHYEQAKAAACLSGSVPFELHAVGEQAFILLDNGKPASAADILSKARKIANQKCSTVLRSWLTAAHGEALAANGQTSESLHAFDIAETLRPNEATGDTGPYVVLDSVHLARWRGHAMAMFAGRDTASILLDTLSKLDPTYVRAKAALAADLAYSFETTGDRTEAHYYAREARLLAQQIGSVRLRDRVRAMVAHQGESACNVEHHVTDRRENT